MPKNKFESILAIVPARAGSKGVPKKNLRKLGSKTLLGWTHESVASVNSFKIRTILSTESEEIAELGRSVGLEVPFLRPEALAQDRSSSMSVVEHALAWFKENESYRPDLTMVLQPTSPFRTGESIEKGLDLMADPAFDAVIGATRIERSLGLLFFPTSKGYLCPVVPGSDQTPQRQLAKEMLTPNGALYIIRTDVLEKEHTFFTKRLGVVRMGVIESLDVDTLEDWALAESWAKTLPVKL